MNTRFPRKKAMEPRRDEADLGSDIRVIFYSRKNIMDEIILVVQRSKLLKETWHGFKANNLDQSLSAIHQNKEFLLRSIMEQDENYKQIVSYMIFKFENKIFLMQRRSTASEQRLKNKLSIGIGGHIKQEDVINDSIIDWSMREFKEEINYSGNLRHKFIGLINDDSNNVGRVHMGLVFLLEGDSEDISIKSELKEGRLVEIDELKNYADKMESWSQMALDYINTI